MRVLLMSLTTTRISYY